MDTKPKLTVTGGIARLSATDEHGNAFLQFEVDSLAEQEPGSCEVCGAEVSAGWLCLDGGEVYCGGCVSIEGKA